MVIMLGDIFWHDALHSRDPGIKTLTEFVDIFQHLQNGQIGFVRVWGGKSTRDKTFLSLKPLLGLPAPGPSDPLSGAMCRLCHNSAAPTSYHPFHKHLRFIIDPREDKAQQRYKDEGMGWTKGHVQLPQPRCDLAPGPTAPWATPL